MEKRQVEIVPSLLCKTKKEFLAKLRRIEPYVKRAQFDIMDNKFVPNKTVQPKEFKGLKTSVEIECQLMVKNPAEYLSDCLNMNAKRIIFHYESLKDTKKILALINQLITRGLQAGIAINPKTPATKIKRFLKLVDVVLVMTVKPGFGGQKLIPSTLKKVTQIRKWAPKLDIEVDGGINKDTAPLAVKAGANILVAGNAIHKAKTVPEGLEAIRSKI
ncbi:MAG: ribulose-phosphate 3-epimerase [Candidatus Woesearchaeota archaeon]